MTDPRLPLTPRQSQVVRLVSEGCADKEIAASLGISEAGVRKHLEAVFRKYSVANRTALVRAAVQAGDLELRH